MNNMIFFDLFYQWTAHNMTSVNSVIIAAGVSALIDIRSRKPLLYILTGSLICGLFSFATIQSLDYFGIPKNAGVLISALIGFLGADKLRRFSVKIISRRTGMNESKHKKGNG